MKKALFSENFIVINAEQTVKDAFDIIKELSPKYLIVSRINGEKHFHYVFLTNLLESYLTHCKTKRDPSSEKLIDFLILHEYDGVKDRTVSIQDPTTDPQLNELSTEMPNGGFEVLIDNNQKIIGVMDSIRLDKTSNYEIMGVGFQDKLVENQSEEFETGDRSKDEQLSPSEPRERMFRNASRRIVPKGSDRSTRKKSTSNNQENTMGTITKYASATLNENIPIGTDSKFRIILKHANSADGRLGKVILEGIEKNQKETKLTVMVMSDPPGFVDFVGDTYTEMKVPLESKDSKPIEFVIRPKQSGWCIIKAQFYHKGSYAGNIGVKTKVVEEQLEQRPASSTSSLNLDVHNEGADLSLHILEMNSTPQKLEYMIMIISEKLGYPQKIFKQISLKTNPEKYFGEFFRSIEEDGFEEDGSYDPQVIEDNLVAKGQNLYSELFPLDFQEFFWKHRNNINSIQVISQEPWIPWEIIKPWKNGENGPEEDEFLCVKYAFTRWLENVPIKQKTKIEKIKIVVPKDTNLPSAKKEFQWIKQFATQSMLKAENVTRDSKYSEVMKSLKEGGFDLLHFSTHGSYEKKYAKMSALVLQDGKLLRAENINGITANFGQDNPVVILNACETGRQGFSLTGIGSWADAFLKAKSSAFIGTLWSIDDVTAQKFTEHLYQNLRNKIPLDKAVQSARIEARQHGDPSWLAYTLYAPSNTTITLGE